MTSSVIVEIRLLQVLFLVSQARCFVSVVYCHDAEGVLILFPRYTVSQYLQTSIYITLWWSYWLLKELRHISHAFIQCLILICDLIHFKRFICFSSIISLGLTVNPTACLWTVEAAAPGGNNNITYNLKQELSHCEVTVVTTVQLCPHQFM